MIRPGSTFYRSQSGAASATMASQQLGVAPISYQGENNGEPNSSPSSLPLIRKPFVGHIKKNPVPKQKIRQTLTLPTAAEIDKRYVLRPKDIALFGQPDRVVFITLKGRKQKPRAYYQYNKLGSSLYAPATHTGEIGIKAIEAKPRGVGKTTQILYAAAHQAGYSPTSSQNQFFFDFNKQQLPPAIKKQLFAQ